MKVNAERAHERHNEFIDRYHEASITGGSLALRTAVLINGGAAIAILALLGALVQQNKISAAQLSSVADSLLWFAYGVIAAVLALGFSYGVYHIAGLWMGSKDPKWEHPYIVGGSKFLQWVAITMEVLAMAPLSPH